MIYLKRIFSEWLGYSRGERRASMILVIIIAAVLSVRYLIPEKGIDIKVSTIMPSSTVSEHSKSDIIESDSTRLFKFDPNTVSFGELTSLGFPGKIASTLIRYRNSGGTFRQPRDILKVYGIDSVMAMNLMPYIKIEPAYHEKKRVVAAVMVTPEKQVFVSEMIDINSCDSTDLEVLPGIGPVLSARIIKYRELLGGYINVSQLKEVYGIADSVYQGISGRINIDTSAIRRVDINIAGFRELDRHPYIERYDAQAIIKYREIKGKIENISELGSNRILTEAKIKKLVPYFSF